jgi:hypothetical protein
MGASTRLPLCEKGPVTYCLGGQDGCGVAGFATAIHETTAGMAMRLNQSGPPFRPPFFSPPNFRLLCSRRAGYPP